MRYGIIIILDVSIEWENSKFSWVFIWFDIPLGYKIISIEWRMLIWRVWSNVKVSYNQLIHRCGYCLIDNYFWINSLQLLYLLNTGHYYNFEFKILPSYSKRIFKIVSEISDESVHWFSRKVAHHARRKSFFRKRI